MINLVSKKGSRNYPVFVYLCYFLLIRKVIGNSVSYDVSSFLLLSYANVTGLWSLCAVAMKHQQLVWVHTAFLS